MFEVLEGRRAARKPKMGRYARAEPVAPQVETLRAARRRRPRRSDLTEAAILDAAWALLAEKPLSLITIEDVATRAGISRSTFYFYFASKAAMMRGLSGQVMAEVRDAAAPFFDGPNGYDIRKGVTSYLQRWKEQGHLLRATAMLEEHDMELRAFWSRLTDDLIGELAFRLDRARRAGIACPASPSSRRLVHALFDMLWKTGRDISLAPPSLDDEKEIIDTLTAIIGRACFGTPGASTSTPAATTT